MSDKESTCSASAAGLTAAHANASSTDHMAGFCMRRTTAIRGFLGMAAMAMLPLLVSQKALAADDYPSKPIRLVIPYGTGGVSDAIGRVLATGMSKALGQTVFAENRGGGGGTIGAAVVAKSTPDGYTILLTSPPMVAVAPALLPNLLYDAVEDFTPIGTLVTTPNILVVNPSLPVKTMADLGAYGKGEGKDQLSFASAGPGSTGHLSGHILKTAMGIEMAHIPYKSSGLAFPDVIAGRVSMVFDSLPSTLSHVRSGKVRPIAVMSEKRSAVLPDVPTAAEAGYPAATMVFWMAIEGPPKMPPAIVEKLNAALRTAVASQAMRDQIATLGAEPFVTSPQEFNTLRRRDITKLRALVKEMGLRSE
jgi:tripartite-type tricarboxylate transporter receptor subunit TctC